jgi:hypothetical protein
MAAAYSAALVLPTSSDSERPPRAGDGIGDGKGEEEIYGDGKDITCPSTVLSAMGDDRDRSGTFDNTGDAGERDRLQGLASPSIGERRGLLGMMRSKSRLILFSGLAGRDRLVNMGTAALISIDGVRLTMLEVRTAKFARGEGLGEGEGSSICRSSYSLPYEVSQDGELL